MFIIDIHFSDQQFISKNVTQNYFTFWKTIRNISYHRVHYFKDIINLVVSDTVVDVLSILIMNI